MNIVKLSCFGSTTLALLILSPARCQEFIRYEYGQTLVLQETQGGSLYVLSGHADPIMFTSKASFSIWRVESLDLLNQYLDAQREQRSKPEGVDERMSKLLTATLETDDFRSLLKAFDLELGWLPGGTHSCQLEWYGGKGVRVGLLNPNVRIPRFGRNQMLSIDEFNKKLTEL